MKCIALSFQSQSFPLVCIAVSLPIFPFPAGKSAVAVHSETGLTVVESRCQALEHVLAVCAITLAPVHDNS